MKSSEIRANVAAIIEARGITLIADTPLNPLRELTQPGFIPSSRSAAIGPCIVSKVSPGYPSAKVEALYPVAILWRFPGSVPYHTLPVGSVESLAVDLTVNPGICDPTGQWDIGVDDYEISVYRYEDRTDWVIELGIVFKAVYQWEPEDLTPILGPQSVDSEELFTIDTVVTGVNLSLIHI